MTLSLEGISKRFDDVVALEGIELEAGDGELMAVVGPSGSGKSTLLRCIAGLEKPDAGCISVGGRDVSGLAPGERDVAMVFQEYALYPHLDAAANIAFGLKARKVDPSTVAERVSQAVELLGLEPCLHRRPPQMSGGERQRVALARAIVREPTVFLMDEPLSNLDAELRTKTRAEIRSLQKRLGTTMLYVTHDQTEAFTLGDRVAVLRDGRIEQIGTPEELYESPANTFVAHFIGMPSMNLFSGSYVGRDAETIGVRPDRMRVVEVAEGRLAGRVVLVERLGSHSLVHVDVGGNDVRALTDGWDRRAVGEEVGLLFIDSDVHVFAPDGAVKK